MIIGAVEALESSLEKQIHGAFPPKMAAVFAA